MICKNGQNLKILVEIIRQKFIVSSFILAFLDHLKTRIFFVGQSWWLTESAPLFRISEFAPDIYRIKTLDLK